MAKHIALRALGYFFSVVPPVLAILERFPVWVREGGRATLSGIALLLLLVAVIPLRRGLRAALSRWLSSPSAYGIWAVIWIFCAWFGRIAVAVAEIALVGLISSLIGAFFFRLAGRGEPSRE